MLTFRNFLRRTNLLNKNKFFTFSETILETKEEKELRYEDQRILFEREWTKVYKEKLALKQDYLDKELNEHQKKECDMLIERILQLDSTERMYFNHLVKDKIKKTTSTDPFKLNVFMPDLHKQTEGIWPQNNPNWYNTNSLLAAVTPFLSSGYFGGGAVAGGPASAAADSAGPAAEAKKEEPKAEKAVVEIKLNAFDAAKKINLIKEVRGILNLGLKEAKELVEKAPVSLKKDVPRAEAVEIQQKLSASGAMIELV